VSSSSDRGLRPLASSPAIGYITLSFTPTNLESFMQTLETYLYARFSEYSTRYAAILVLISLLTDLTAGQQTALITLAAALAGTPDKGAKQ
jgi:hypothetical protein